MTLALLIIAICITAFIRKHRLEGKYGLTGWPEDTKRYLYFIPMWFLTTGNLWDGFGVAYHGSNQVYAVTSMLLIGYVEEIIFRGFLFRALIPRDGIKAATIISSVTFGIGHIINLLAGQADIEAVATVFFAIAWGFIFTYVFYKSGSLVPGIIAHGLVDAFSKFAANSDSHAITTMDMLYIGATILTAVIYGAFLSRLPVDKEE